MALDIFVWEGALVVENTEDGPCAFRKFFLVTRVEGDPEGVYRASPELYYWESEAQAAIEAVTPDQVEGWIKLPPEPSLEEKEAEYYRLEQEARRYGER